LRQVMSARQRLRGAGTFPCRRR